MPLLRWPDAATARHGDRPRTTTRAVAQGQQAAMKRFFATNETDGGTAEVHAGYFNQVDLRR